MLWYCWLGNRKGIQPVKNWVLVCWWWWYDWSFAWLIAPVVTTTYTILCFNKHRLTQVHPKKAVKMEREEGVQAQLNWELTEADLDIENGIEIGLSEWHLRDHCITCCSSVSTSITSICGENYLISAVPAWMQKLNGDILLNKNDWMTWNKPR